MMSNIYKEINANYERLSETEQEVIDFILKFKDIGCLKMKDIRDKLYVSNSTIMRACKKLNYATFSELKYAFVQSTKEKKKEAPIEADLFQIIDGIKKDTLTTLELVDEKELDLICDCLLQSRRIFCVGSGSSSQVASEFNRKLKLIDLWTNDYSDKFSIERIPQISTSQDVIVVFSLSGEVSEINEIMIRAKSNGTKIIAVTNMSVNQLKSLSTYSLLTYSSPSNRKKLRSRLMLYVMSTLIYEKLITKIPSFE
jgi:DNA-binding MurR/RpiR family transcriptional regulator